MSLKASTTIAAPASKVWDRLGKFSTWKDWNPFFASCTDLSCRPPEPVTIGVNWKGKICEEKLTLTEYDSSNMAWKIHAANNFFLEQYIACTVKATSATTSQVDCETQFGGLFGKPSLWFVGTETHRGITNMVNDLKTKCEN